MWKWVLGTAFCCGTAGLFRSEYEKRQLSVEYFTIGSEKIKNERTIVFLSDLHDQEFGKGNEKLLQAIDQAKPDFVLIGGDMMVSKKKAPDGKRANKKPADKEKAVTDVALSLVLRLAEKYPVYYGNGNHEQRMKEEREIYGNQYQDYRKALKEAGVVYLSDQNVILEDLAIGGFNFRKKYYRRFTHAVLSSKEMEEKLGKADKSRFQILLAHSPMYFKECRRWGADLTLSGHFHGGTIRLPWLGGVMTPQFQFFYPRCAGIFKEEGKWMIVSRGLGTHSIRIRFCNKPQVVVVKLKNSAIV